MTTKRDNLRQVLKGEPPEWVPFALNCAQWYRHHCDHGTVPDELSTCTDYIDVLKALDADIFTRNVDAGVRTDHEDVEPLIEQSQGSQGPRTTTRWRTPHGELRQVHETQTKLSTGYMVEDLVKDWERDGEAYLWLLERLRFTWDADQFDAIDRKIDDDGLVLVPVGHTPLKHLHVDFGLDNACLFMLDHPEAAQKVCDLFWQRLWPVLEVLAAAPRVEAVCLMDNVDAPFYPPDLARQYWAPYVRQAVDLFESRGKRVFVHACGQLRALIEVFRESGVHGLEGMAHPPLGDFTPADARRVHERFIYNGGFTAHEQVNKSDDELRRFYDDLFNELDGWPRFIFGAACQTSINTPWQRIKFVRDLCREHGGRPNATHQLNVKGG